MLIFENDVGIRLIWNKISAYIFWSNSSFHEIRLWDIRLTPLLQKIRGAVKPADCVWLRCRKIYLKSFPIVVKFKGSTPHLMPVDFQSAFEILYQVIWIRDFSTLHDTTVHRSMNKVQSIKSLWHQAHFINILRLGQNGRHGRHFKMHFSMKM